MGEVKSNIRRQLQYRRAELDEQNDNVLREERDARNRFRIEKGQESRLWHSDIEGHHPGCVVFAEHEDEEGDIRDVWYAFACRSGPGAPGDAEIFHSRSEAWEYVFRAALDAYAEGLNHGDC